MNEYCPNFKCEFVEEKRKLLYWIARRADEEAQFDNINLDIPEMSALLQSIGFRLETFEKVFDCGDIPILRKFPNVTDRNIMKIELTCEKSGMSQTLIKQTSICKCPSEEEVDKGQFWCVAECESLSDQNLIKSPKSSLFPIITPAKTNVIKGLLLKILMVINGTDINENDVSLQPIKNVSSLTRHHSLETLKSSDESGFVSNRLKRVPSWEMDSKMSPATETSSPVPNLCPTVCQLLVNAEQPNTFIKNLESIKKLVDKTLDMAKFVENTLPKKRVSDIKPTDDLCVSDLIQFSSPTTCIKRATPRRLLTPKKSLPKPVVKSDDMAAPSKIPMIRKKSFVGGVLPNAAKLLKKDTLKPRTGLVKQNIRTGGSYESIFKSKVLDVHTGMKNCVSPKLIKKSEAGTSRIAKFKSVEKLSLITVIPGKKKT